MCCMRAASFVAYLHYHVPSTVHTVKGFCKIFMFRNVYQSFVICMLCQNDVIVCKCMTWFDYDLYIIVNFHHMLNLNIIFVLPIDIGHPLYVEMHLHIYQ